MKRILLSFLGLLLSCNLASAQTLDAKDGRFVKKGVSLARENSDTISVQRLLKNPVVTARPGIGTVVGFDISWVVSDGKEPTYMGPYKITGNTINGVALENLKSSAAKGKVTRMFVDEVKLALQDGTLSDLKTARAYRVIK